mmetsp:Transcript_12748/g.25344  ORF Transcript_12748/g.25344 Transcript_12748/m.25344 type:complete len:236 (+) Transcript_12748:1847-2554(+)
MAASAFSAAQERKWSSSRGGGLLSSSDLKRASKYSPERTVSAMALTTSVSVPAGSTNAAFFDFSALIVAAREFASLIAASTPNFVELPAPAIESFRTREDLGRRTMADDPSFPLNSFVSTISLMAPSVLSSKVFAIPSTTASAFLSSVSGWKIGNTSRSPSQASGAVFSTVIFTAGASVRRACFPTIGATPAIARRGITDPRRPTAGPRSGSMAAWRWPMLASLAAERPTCPTGP